MRVHRSAPWSASNIVVTARASASSGALAVGAGLGPPSSAGAAGSGFAPGVGAPGVGVPGTVLGALAAMGVWGQTSRITTSPACAGRASAPVARASAMVFCTCVSVSSPMRKRSVSTLPVTGCLSLMGRHSATVAPLVAPRVAPRSRTRSSPWTASTAPSTSVMPTAAVDGRLGCASAGAPASVAPRAARAPIAWWIKGFGLRMGCGVSRAACASAVAWPLSNSPLARNPGGTSERW